MDHRDKMIVYDQHKIEKEIGTLYLNQVKSMQLDGVKDWTEYDAKVKKLTMHMDSNWSQQYTNLNTGMENYPSLHTI